MIAESIGQFITFRASNPAARVHLRAQCLQRAALLMSLPNTAPCRGITADGAALEFQAGQAKHDIARVMGWSH